MLRWIVTLAPNFLSVSPGKAGDNLEADWVSGPCLLDGLAAPVDRAGADIFPSERERLIRLAGHSREMFLDPPEKIKALSAMTAPGVCSSANNW